MVVEITWLSFITKNFLMNTSIFWSLTGRSSSLFKDKIVHKVICISLQLNCFTLGLWLQHSHLNKIIFYKTNAQLPPIWTLLARFIFTFGAFYTDFIYVYLSKFISWWRHLVSRLCILPLVVPPQQLETQMREMYFGL